MKDAVISFPMFGSKFKLDPPSSITMFGREFYIYGIIIAIGFVLAALYLFKNAKRYGLTQDNMIDMLLCAVPSGIIGARLYYVVFTFSEFKRAKFLDTLWECCKIWEGGLAIYGGIIFGVLAIIIYCKIKKLPFLTFLDIAGIAVMIGQAVGRWGNFFNREAYGYNGINVEVPWKMGLQVKGQSIIYVHPTFLYECLWNVIGILLIHQLSKKRKYDGQVFLMYVTWYGLGRALIEGLRADSLMLGDVRVSQALATATFVIGALILLINWVRGRDPKNLYVNRLAMAEAEEAGEEDESDADEISDETAESEEETEETEEETEETGEADNEDTPDETETTEAETEDEDEDEEKGKDE